MGNGISLAEALRELRQELYTAQADGAHQQFQFEVQQAELTLEVEFRRDGNGKVKVDVGAFGAKVGGEAGGSLGSTHRQTLTLTLQVHDEATGGARARIRRQDGGLGPNPAGGASGATDGRAEDEPEDDAEDGSDEGTESGTGQRPEGSSQDGTGRSTESGSENGTGRGTESGSDGSDSDASREEARRRPWED
ncbi:trypco2 family protein [Streptomyces sp. SS]|uniref:trypco2 family protein n=1 Tax=Streptomyces sp. SS TaxID=260742 RepID=UPI00030A26CE|nr:trypco2 family protein [Streptomyces sp. SS]